MKKLSKESVVIKHSAVVHISNEFTKLQRTAFNVMLYCSYDNLLTQKIHTIKLSFLKKALGIKDEDDEQFKKNEYLKKAVVGLGQRGFTIDILEKAAKYLDKSKLKKAGYSIDVGGQIVLSIFKVVNPTKKGVIEYEFNEYLADLLYNPEMYAKIKLSIQQNFINKYAVALYEVCIDYIGVGQTPDIKIMDLKRLLLGEKIKKAYNQFKYFNNLVLKTAIKNINDDTDLFITPEFKRVGRKISTVKFYVSEKDKMKEATVINSDHQKSDNSVKYNLNKAKVDLLVKDILEFTDHPKSEKFYYKIAWKLVTSDNENLIYQALSEVKGDFIRDEGIKKNRAAVFNSLIQRLAKERGVDLGLKK